MEQQRGVAIFVPSGSDFAKYNHEDLTPKIEYTTMIYSYTSFGANIALPPHPISIGASARAVPALASTGMEHCSALLPRPPSLQRRPPSRAAPTRHARGVLVRRQSPPRSCTLAPNPLTQIGALVAQSRAVGTAQRALLLCQRKSRAPKVSAKWLSEEGLAHWSRSSRTGTRTRSTPARVGWAQS